MKEAIKKLEIEQNVLDRRIVKKHNNYESMLALTGQNNYGSLQSEVLASIELTQRRIDAQVVDKQKVVAEQERLHGDVAKENEKNSKLVSIAESKYNLILGKVDLYLPKGKDHEEKLKRMEKGLIHEQREIVHQIKNENKAEEQKLIQAKRHTNDMKEKIAVLKTKLKK